MTTLYEIFNSRRDTRHFTSDVVPDEVIKKALEAGNTAPSVGLTDATRYYIIKSSEVKQGIKKLFEEYNQKAHQQIKDEAQKATYSSLKLEAICESPLGLVICYDRSVLNNFSIGTVASNETLKFSSVCAAQNVWLSLTEQGYSMGWVSILNYYQFKKMLGLPEEIEPLGYFCIGKPATDYEKQPMLQQLKWKEKQKEPVVAEINCLRNEVSNIRDEKKNNFHNSTGSIQDNLQLKIDNKTKPLGSLGILEKLAKQTGEIFKTNHPNINKPHIVVFAADHGIAQHGLSAYPQEVTRQMVDNFLSGGAAINVFCRQHSIGLTIVDAGVNYDFPSNTMLVNNKIGKGTQSFLYSPAMSPEQVHQCMDKGAEVVNKIAGAGCNTIGFGEMGIGNTSSASVLMSLLCNIPIEHCIGTGTGVNDEKLSRKHTLLKQAVTNYKDNRELFAILEHFGGFEILQMAGAMAEAYKNNMLILVDGFISTVAFLIAFKINPGIKQNAIFCHCSAEKAHRMLLDYLQVKEILQLDMRLGEGTGCAVAFPIIQSAVNFLNEMASFESAGVSNKENISAGV
jgi:nicotinate-nucleotide--dimethylbenzimidazole phosphoribosyltransferase